MRRFGVFAGEIVVVVALSLGASCGGGTLGPDPDAGGDAPVRPVADGGAASLDGAREVARDRGLAPTPAEAAIAKLAEAGFARGLNVCRCGLPGVVDAELAACARDESGPARLLFLPDGRRCAGELARDSAEALAFVECEAARITKVASCEAGGCAIKPECAISDVCPIPPGQGEAWARCWDAFYCGDMRADEMRCNGVVECRDGLDERGCP